MEYFKTSVSVRAPLDTLFDFFIDPRNLKKVSPQGSGLRVEHADLPLRVGSRVRVRFRAGLFPIDWELSVQSLKRGDRFIDWQERGPFREWRHTHLFIRNGNSTTVVDMLEYEVPFGFLGGILNNAFIRPAIEKYFQHRQARLTELFGEGRESARRDEPRRDEPRRDEGGRGGRRGRWERVGAESGDKGGDRGGERGGARGGEVSGDRGGRGRETREGREGRPSRGGRGGAGLGAGPGAGAGGRRERGDRGEREVRPARGEREERPARGERPERGGREERGGRGERVDRAERTDRGPRGERAERTDRGRRDERDDRGGRGEPAEGGPRPERGERVERGPRGGRGDRGDERSLARAAGRILERERLERLRDMEGADDNETEVARIPEQIVDEFDVAEDADAGAVDENGAPKRRRRRRRGGRGRSRGPERIAGSEEREGLEAGGPIDGASEYEDVAVEPMPESEPSWNVREAEFDETEEEIEAEVEAEAEAEAEADDEAEFESETGDSPRGGDRDRDRLDESEGEREVREAREGRGGREGGGREEREGRDGPRGGRDRERGGRDRGGRDRGDRGGRGGRRREEGFDSDRPPREAPTFVTLYPPPPPAPHIAPAPAAQRDFGFDDQPAPDRASPAPSAPITPIPPITPDAVGHPSRSAWGRAPQRASTRRPQPVKEPESPKERDAGSSPPSAPAPDAPDTDFPEGA